MERSRFFWIKLYCEILDDPKMGRLSSDLWRKAVELFLLAGRFGRGGVLQPVEELAWCLNTSKERMGRVLDKLAEVQIVSQLECGDWMVTHFASRQGPVSASERQAKHRRYGKVAARVSHDNVTDIYIEKDLEKEKENLLYRDVTSAENLAVVVQKATDRAGRVAGVLKEFNFSLNESAGQIIDGWLDEFPGEEGEAIIGRAIEHAANHSANSLAYVHRILAGWRANGAPGSRGAQVEGARRRKVSKKDDFFEALERTLQEHPDL